MPLQIRRQSDGRLMARNDSGPELFLLGRSRRVVNRKTFEVRHYMIPSDGVVVFAMKGLSMSMLHNAGACSDIELGRSTRQVGIPKPVWYEGKVFMIFPNIQSAGTCLLVNAESQVLAGSNLFNRSPPGTMCLGTAIDPLTLSPVDALCFNNANRDLGWMGNPVTGAWERNPDPANPRSRAANQIFKIETWPTWSNLQTPLPPQVLAACQDW